jgi:serine protease AprX
MNARRLRAVVVTAAVLVGAVAGSSGPAAACTVPSAAASTTSAGSTGPGSAAPGQRRFVVRLGSARQAAVVAAAERAGGRLVAAQAGLGTVVLDLPAGAETAVAGVPGVAAVAADRAVRPLSLGFDPSGQPGSMTAVTRVTGAQQLWRRGITGAGVDVALIDTGVAPVDALDDPNKVVVGPDLSVDSQAVNLRNLDVYGHGTHMAGIIAGREGGPRTGLQYVAAARNDYLGMAPDARIISLKVAATDGAVDVSQLIAAIDWVVQFGDSDGMNIRVLNLSLGTESTQDPAIDPLAWAAENAWHAGIVVVASAGNSGGRLAGLDDPASNPWVLAVGAADTNGTDTLADDDVPGFSARPAAGARRGIDLVAPGVKIVGPAVGGSSLYGKAESTAKIGNGFLRGSGTSQAAAVVSGAVALLLDEHPELTPDQVKAALRSTAVPLQKADPSVQGAGELNLGATDAVRSPVGHRVTRRMLQFQQQFQQQQRQPQEQQLPRGTGTGSLEAARGGAHLVLNGKTLAGERDIFGRAWDSTALAAAAAQGTAWSPDGWFNGSNWTGAGFAADTSNAAGLTWSGRTWSGSTWSGSTWSGSTWSGSTWSGSTWSGSTWSSRTWSGSTWSGSTWSGSTWSGTTWSGEVWQGKKWA